MQVRRTRVEGTLRGYRLIVLNIAPADVDYSAGEMEKHYKLLASQVGNLASRIASPKLQKRFLQAATSHPDATSLVHPEVQELRRSFLRCRDVLEERLDGLDISRGLEEAMEMVFEVSERCN
jgi:methionyl-tRNA synthetase